MGAEDPVARIAQAGEDVAVLVELPIDRRRVDRNFGMRFAERADAFGTRDEADHAHRARPCFLEALYRGNGRIAGREHRVRPERLARRPAVRPLELVL